jgi:hypothetical protein
MWPRSSRRRLLSKTDAAQIMLGQFARSSEENNLKTLFDFADGSIRLKNYRDREHFVASYPFPPYQYTLFQMAITSLSQHNAFEGKHSSVGERSMLGRVPRGGQNPCRSSCRGACDLRFDVRGDPHCVKVRRPAVHPDRRAEPRRSLRGSRSEGIVPCQVREGIQADHAQHQRSSVVGIRG